MKEKFTIGIDIDGTLTDPGYFIPYLNRHFNRDIDFSTVTEYDFRELYHATDDELRDFFVGEGKGIMFIAPLLEGAQRTVLELAEKHEVHIITARRADLHEKTQHWLNDVGLGSIRLHTLGSPRKRELAQSLGCDFFLEDHPTASEEIAEAGISVLLMDAPYNRQTGHSNMKRVYGWEDIRNELMHKGVL